MSSALRRIAQIPKPIKFLRGVTVDPGYIIVSDASMGAFLLDNADNVVESLTGIRTVVRAAAGPPTSTILTTEISLVRDMGRRVTVRSTADGAPLLQVWIQVQAVDGPNTSGVPPDYDTTDSFWICTWTADAGGALHVDWVRTG
jgi:hypothetical protein